MLDAKWEQQKVDLLYFRHLSEQCCIQIRVIMGKVKKTRQYPFYVKIQFWVPDRDEKIHKDVVEAEVNSEFITFDQINDPYQKFLEEQQIDYETDMYYIPPDDRLPHQKITPGYKISLDKIQEVGFLFILGKDRLEQYKIKVELQIDSLHRQLKFLRQEIKELRQFKDEFEFYKKNSFGYNKMLSIPQSFHENSIPSGDIDLAVLFSEPLYNDENRLPTSQPVDFRSEISRLKLALENSYTPLIRMRCEIGRTETLRNIIRLSKPKILHIICHGTEQGSIQFEDNSAHNLGLVNYVKPQDIKKLLRDSTDFLPQIIFVNSCHSQKIGRAFADIGVKVVVMINSQDLINDQAAQLFSEKFYRNIFMGETVQKSFQVAKQTVQMNHYSYGCCCSTGNHGALEPHKQNCRWIYVIQKKHPNPHKDYHVPSSKCLCPSRNFNRHKKDCQWAKKVLFEINQDFRKKLENGKEVFPKESEYPDYYDREKKQFIICCCPYKDRKPHNQCYKFKILVKQGCEKQKLYEIKTQNKPQLQDTTPSELAEAVFKAKNIYGRQKQLYTFLKLFRENVIMLIYGISGTGLTTFAVKAASYALQRKICEYYFFIDLYEIKQETVFRFKFNEATGFKYTGSGTITYGGIKYKKMLVLLDNCDDFLRYAPEQFYREIHNLQKELPHTKFIIIIKDETMNDFDEKKILCCKYELEPLDTWFAKSFLLTKLKDKTDLSVGFLECGKLIREYPVLKIPKIVESLSQSLPDPSYYDRSLTPPKKATYEVITNNIKQITQNDDNHLIKQVFDNLKDFSEETYEFLIFVSQFSEGITFKDLDMLSSYDKKYSKLALPVKEDWRKQFNMLCKRQSFKSLNSDKSEDSFSSQPKFETFSSYKDSVLEIPDFEAQITEQTAIENKRKKSILSDNSTDVEGKEQSYFIEKINDKKFVVKRFIRDYVWNKCSNPTTNQMKFLYIVYFSVVLELLFQSIQSQNVIHQELLTYSAISKSGVFSYVTSLDGINKKKKERQMTVSTRIVHSRISQLQLTFSNSDILQSKLKNTDLTSFILNHKQDFLKIYDLDWNKYILEERKVKQQSKKKEEQIRAEDKLVMFILQNLMIYIPTAFKIASKKNSDDLQLLQFVISRSNSGLENLRKNSKDLLRSIQIQLKVYLMEIGLILETHSKRKVQENEEQLKKIGEKALNLFMKYGQIFKENEEFKELKNIFEEEKKNCQLFLNHQYYDEKQDQFDKIRTYIANWSRNKQVQVLLMSKQALLLSMLYLKFISTFKVHSLLSKQNRQTNFNDVIQMIEFAADQFSYEKCRKLKLKAELMAIQIYWKYNTRLEYQNQAIDHKQIDDWRLRLIECQKFYYEERNKLSGFTEFDEIIKTLKKQIKQKLWKLAQNTVIFMRAYPLSSDGHPIIANLVRKKNNFKKEMEAIFTHTIKERPVTTQNTSLKHKDSTSSYTKDPKSFTLDVSAKFQILTYEKLKEETSTGCSVMFLSCNFRQIKKKIYMITQGDFMNENLVEINKSFAEMFPYDKVCILILAGQNAGKAVNLISKYSNKPPAMIALDQIPEENLEEIPANIQINSEWIKSSFAEISEIREAQLTYLKIFIKKLIKAKINSKKIIEQIHNQANDSLLKKKTSKVKAILRIQKCENFFLAYKPGCYRDLTPGYQSNNNLNPRFFKMRVILRRWKKMVQVLKFLQGDRDRNFSNLDKLSMDEEDKSSERFSEQYNSNIFVGFQPENGSLEFQNSRKPAYINVYGEPGSGKSFFINEIAKILVERELYNFGVFLFDGKTIEIKYNGDFQSYIRSQSKTNNMPVFQDFQKILGQNLILIIDDFNYIKPRSNARLKLFFDKIIENKVNLILVSTTALDPEWTASMKKIKLEKLDQLETQILAYNILNVNNSEEVSEYQKKKLELGRKLNLREISKISKKFQLQQNSTHDHDRRVSLEPKKIYSIQQ